MIRLVTTSAVTPTRSSGCGTTLAARVTASNATGTIAGKASSMNRDPHSAPPPCAYCSASTRTTYTPTTTMSARGPGSCSSERVSSTVPTVMSGQVMNTLGTVSGVVSSAGTAATTATTHA